LAAKTQYENENKICSSRIFPQVRCALTVMHRMYDQWLIGIGSAAINSALQSKKAWSSQPFKKDYHVDY